MKALILPGVFCLFVFSGVQASSLEHVAQDRVHYDAASQTWQVTGCEFEDVDAAILAASSGDTVEIGAGHCDWGNDANGQPLWSRKQLYGGTLYVRGQGMDQTTIHRTTPIGGAEEPLLYFNCGSGGSVEMSHIRFLGNDDEQEDDPATRRADKDIGIQINGQCVDLKLHNMEFEKFSNTGIMLRGGQTGVIYHNRFISNYKCYPLGQPDDNYPCLGYGVGIWGNNTWPDPAYGSGDKIFIEDNYFHDNRHAIAAHLGALYVARHNEIVGTERTANWSEIDAHGLTYDKDGNELRGTRSWEIYHNLLITEVAPPRGAHPFVPRGGDGVFFNNRIEGRFANTARIVVESYRADCDGSWPPGERQWIKDQTREAWIWGNGHDENKRFPVGHENDEQYVSTSSGSFDCSYYLREGLPDDPPDTWEYTLHPKAGYQPYVYPHPLRDDLELEDLIFEDAFQADN